MKNFFIISTLFVCVPLLMAVPEGDRSYNGWGASVTAGTTPTYVAVEQTPGAELISNGTFATTNNWIKGDGWIINGGTATATNNAAGTNSLTQTGLSLTTQSEYRITYTITALAGGTITPSVGNAVLTARTTTGTFTEDVSFVGTARIAFSFASADAATGTIDNVSIYSKPDRAWVGQLKASVNATDLPVYLYLDGTDAGFTNAYRVGRTLMVTSNESLTIDLNNTGRKMSKIYYRTASGSSTLSLSGW